MSPRVGSVRTVEKGRNGLASSVWNRSLPFVPTYPARSTKWLVSWRCSSKLNWSRRGARKSSATTVRVKSMGLPVTAAPGSRAKPPLIPLELSGWRVGARLMAPTKGNELAMLSARLRNW